MSKEFGEWLQQRRDDVALSQTELGEKISVTQQTIAKWESGKALPRPKVMRQLSVALGVEYSAVVDARFISVTSRETGESSDAALFMQSVFATRRARLLTLIAQTTGGNAPQFATKYGYSKAQIYQFLSESYNYGRSMGEAAARGLEDRAGLPGGWLDQPVDGNAPSVAADDSASPISTGRESEQFALRLPDGMRDAVKEMARSGHRTMNAQMVYLIQRGIEAERGNPGSDLTTLLRQSAGLMSRIAEELDAKPKANYDR